MSITDYQNRKVFEWPSGNGPYIGPFDPAQLDEECRVERFINHRIVGSFGKLYRQRQRAYQDDCLSIARELTQYEALFTDAKIELRKLRSEIAQEESYWCRKAEAAKENIVEAVGMYQDALVQFDAETATHAASASDLVASYQSSQKLMRAMAERSALVSMQRVVGELKLMSNQDVTTESLLERYLVPSRLDENAELLKSLDTVLRKTLQRPLPAQDSLNLAFGHQRLQQVYKRLQESLENELERQLTELMTVSSSQDEIQQAGNYLHSFVLFIDDIQPVLHRIGAVFLKPFFDLVEETSMELDPSLKVGNSKAERNVDRFFNLCGILPSFIPRLFESLVSCINSANNLLLNITDHIMWPSLDGDRSTLTGEEFTSELLTQTVRGLLTSTIHDRASMGDEDGIYSLRRHLDEFLFKTSTENHIAGMYTTMLTRNLVVDKVGRIATLLQTKGSDEIKQDIENWANDLQSTLIGSELALINGVVEQLFKQQIISIDSRSIPSFSSMFGISKYVWDFVDSILVNFSQSELTLPVLDDLPSLFPNASNEANYFRFESIALLLYFLSTHAERCVSIPSSPLRQSHARSLGRAFEIAATEIHSVTMRAFNQVVSDHLHSSQSLQSSQLLGALEAVCKAAKRLLAIRTFLMLFYRSRIYEILHAEDARLAFHNVESLNQVNDQAQTLVARILGRYTHQINLAIVEIFRSMTLPFEYNVSVLVEQPGIELTYPLLAGAHADSFMAQSLVIEAKSRSVIEVIAFAENMAAITNENLGQRSTDELFGVLAHSFLEGMFVGLKNSYPLHGVDSFGGKRLTSDICELQQRLLMVTQSKKLSRVCQYMVVLTKLLQLDEQHVPIMKDSMTRDFPILCSGDYAPENILVFRENRLPQPETETPDTIETGTGLMARMWKQVTSTTDAARDHAGSDAGSKFTWRRKQQ